MWDCTILSQSQLVLRRRGKMSKIQRGSSFWRFLLYTNHTTYSEGPNFDQYLVVPAGHKLVYNVIWE